MTSSVPYTSILYEATSVILNELLLLLIIACLTSFLYITPVQPIDTFSPDILDTVKVSSVIVVSKSSTELCNINLIFLFRDLNNPFVKL